MVNDGLLEGCGESHSVRQELTDATLGIAAAPGAIGLEEATAHALELALPVR